MNSKIPYRTIYSNDTTNILTCTSPYHKKGESFKPEMIRQTVKEVAGKADAHFIQLAHGRVPWYQSKIYPMKEHMKWWSEHFEYPYEKLMSMGGPNGFVRDGGDMLQIFIDACREFGQAPFVSLRMNDTHHIEWRSEKGHINGIHSISRFMVEHPEFILRNEPRSPLNWIYPEVRDTIFELIEEQCENYDIDGFELDFMRHPDLFNLKETTLQQRYDIMNEFILRVRKLLDRTARNGQYRALCIRLPGCISGCYKLGLDIDSFEKIGVDMINSSPSYFTEQNMDISYFTEKCPNTAVYAEMCHCLLNGKPAVETKLYDRNIFKRTTSNQYYTTANMAYKDGAHGISFFNFVYYREHGTEGRGPFNEPPFEVIEKCKYPTLLSKGPQHYFLSKGWNDVSQLKNRLRPGEINDFYIKLLPPDEGWVRDARLRILIEDTFNGRDFSVSFNGIPLVRTDDISELNEEDNQYIPLRGDEQNMNAWVLPKELMINGKNKINITLHKGDGVEPVTIYVIDVLYK